jgi:hypothetical protein
VDIPVELPGLNTLIPRISGGEIVIAESGPDPAKSYFLRTLCRSALTHEGTVTFLTSRGREEVEALFEREAGGGASYSEALTVRERDEFAEISGFDERTGVLAIDSFTMMTLELKVSELASLLRKLRAACRSRGTTVLLATDRGLQGAGAEAVAYLLCDGIVQFHAKEGPEGIIRFLRIPKWADGKFVDRNVYYDFDGMRMAIDLRRRVL